MSDKFPELPAERPILTVADGFIERKKGAIEALKRRYETTKFILVGYASVTVLLLAAGGVSAQREGLGEAAIALGLIAVFSLTGSVVNKSVFLDACNTNIAWHEMDIVSARQGLHPDPSWEIEKAKAAKILENTSMAPARRLWLDMLAIFAFLYFVTNSDADKAFSAWLTGVWSYVWSWL